MWILDRQRYWAFLKAYVICFIALVGLYIVIDAFSNLDEFSEISQGTVHLFKIMGYYYLIRLSLFYDRLCGVIGMMAAIFTVTWMQRNNELLAMLAAGIGTKRVIRPVWISAILVSFGAVANQELLLPVVAEDLQKTPDDDGTIKRPVFGREDANGILIDGKDGDRENRTVTSFNATFPVALTGTLSWVQARQARYIEEDDPTAPQRGGWLLRGARLVPEGATVHDDLLIRLESDEGFPPVVGTMTDLGQETYFLRSSLTFAAVTRSKEWYQFAPTRDLILSLADPSSEHERNDVEIYLHGRLIRPLLSLNLLFLSLPMVLGGTGRNMFINLGLSLATSGVFYAMTFLSQYLASNGVLEPELSAWAPLIAFGTVAVARWDSIRT